jgi:hypothetical protein
MSDDRHPELDAIEALLRATRDDSPPATEAELDAKFDTIMSLLDHINDEQAAELDDLAARARNDLASQADDHLREEHEPSQRAHIQLKQVIHPNSDPDDRATATSIVVAPGLSRWMDHLCTVNSPRLLASMAMLVLISLAVATMVVMAEAFLWMRAVLVVLAMTSSILLIRPRTPK